MDINEWKIKKEGMLRKYGQWGSYDPECDGNKFIFNPRKDYQPMEAVFLGQIVNSLDNFLKKPWSETRILDLACMEGLSSIEFALQGAKEVVGIEGRKTEVARANFIKEAMGLKNVSFYQDDVRNVCKEKYGTFDIVVALGIFYHLDSPNVFNFAKAIGEMAEDFTIIDTHFIFKPKHTVEFGGHSYSGNYVSEQMNSNMEQRMLRGFEFSLDNDKSFWLTKSSLHNLLINVGFTSLYQCVYPRGGNRQEYDDRATLIATKNRLKALQTLVDQGEKALENFPEKQYDIWVVSSFHPRE